MKSSLRRARNSAPLRWMVPALGLLAALGLGGTGCTIQHLTDKSGAYHEAFMVKQAALRLKGSEAPRALTGEEADTVVNNYKSDTKRSGFGNQAAPAKVSLLPLQR